MVLWHNTVAHSRGQYLLSDTEIHFDISIFSSLGFWFKVMEGKIKFHLPSKYLHKGNLPVPSALKLSLFTENSNLAYIPMPTTHPKTF